MALLRVEELATWFRREGALVRAVDGVSFELDQGRTLALVGESGCGKSVTALSIMGLVDCPPGVRAGGRVLYRGQDLLALPEAAMRRLRGNDLAMVFQEPMTSLNPVMRVGPQVVEGLRHHRRLTASRARERAVELLSRVGIPRPEAAVDAWPFELSGGMRQRVVIAMALACDPRVLIADEPTTALDVTVQAQILALLASLQRDTGMAMLFITHDLGIVAEIAHEVAVMYAGQVVEQAPVGALFHEPGHPYTRGLLASLPDPERREARLRTVEGNVPGPGELPSGCRFRNRCRLAQARCADEAPALRDLAPGHRVACHAVEEGRT